MKPPKKLPGVGFYTVIITKGFFAVPTKSLGCLVLNKAGNEDPISITSALYNVSYETHVLTSNIRSQVPPETS